MQYGFSFIVKVIFFSTTCEYIVLLAFTSTIKNTFKMDLVYIISSCKRVGASMVVVHIYVFYDFQYIGYKNIAGSELLKRQK